MTKNNTPAPLPFEPTVKDGESCFRIPLTGRDAVGRFVVVDLEGLERLQRAGARALYLVGNGAGLTYATFIRPGVKDRVYTAARVVAQAPDGQRVVYVSGDRLDLRASNLRFKDGFAPGEAHLAATEQARFANEKIERPSECRRRPSKVTAQTQLAA